ncbi:hypothetical protein TNCV_1106321 [Trichonephila clavipes]|nr:hypothetical protein TNCV_1106321 [Trichonephila clavipes]
MADKDILELVQSSKNITDEDSDDENEMNNAALIATSSEMRSILKSMCNYLNQGWSAHDTRATVWHDGVVAVAREDLQKKF